MKSIVNGIAALAAAAALASAPAWAQDAKPAAKGAGAKPAAKEPKAAPAAHKSRRDQDARACLERASNTEVIKCAEAYL